MFCMGWGIQANREYDGSASAAVWRKPPPPPLRTLRVLRGREGDFFLHRRDFFPLGFERGDGFFVGGEQGAGLCDQLRRRLGGEAFVAELALQAGDVFRKFVDFFVEPCQFGVFVDEARERNHVFRAFDHKGGRFGFGLICGEDAHAVQSPQREQAALLLDEVARGGFVLAADDER